MPLPIHVFLSNYTLWVPTVSLMAVFLLAAVLLSKWISGRTGSNRGLVFLFLAGVAGVLSITLPLRFEFVGLHHCSIENPLDLGNLADPQNYLNLFLYTPAAFFGQLVFRRGYRLVASFAATSAAIEFMQMFSPDRSCTSSDFVLNACGSVIGVLAAQLALMLVGIDGKQDIRAGGEGHRPAGKSRDASTGSR
ncbi:VanZ family protein [Microtetraspora fusca]|uniref:VanZ family protein n=1 Tax=Microtetraspora fusca TaxID=1997 RepID=A0ABW6VC09_MICFU